MGILPKILPKSEEERHVEIERNLIKLESKIGRELFGPIPAGHNREFFCLDERTWIWHEDWLDENGKRVVVSTKYSIRPTGILKSQNGHAYHQIDETEANHFHHAVNKYVGQVKREYHRIIQASSHAA